jgi:O-acetyl-ADP-ribose deacetylase (regulator of RNase III)
MHKISYLVGDATAPQVPGCKIVAHVCNDVGKWGRGFVLALSQRSPLPETAFLQWFAERELNDYGLGAVQFVEVEPDLWVANMIGQHKVQGSRRAAAPPVRYEAIGSALATVGTRAIELQASVHMPRIGCGLAGGKWDLVEPLILEQLCDRGIPVFVYDLPLVASEQLEAAE